jgi:DNA-binding NtrC family response regulator
LAAPPEGGEAQRQDRSKLTRELEDLEKRRIIEALTRCGGNQTQTAKLLGMSRRTLVNRLDDYGIVRPRKKQPTDA